MQQSTIEKIHTYIITYTDTCIHYCYKNKKKKEYVKIDSTCQYIKNDNICRKLFLRVVYTILSHKQFSYLSYFFAYDTDLEIENTFFRLKIVLLMK